MNLFTLSIKCCRRLRDSKTQRRKEYVEVDGKAADVHQLVNALTEVALSQKLSHGFSLLPVVDGMTANTRAVDAERKFFKYLTLSGIYSDI